MTAMAARSQVREGIICRKRGHRLEVAVENMRLSGWYLVATIGNRWKKYFETG